MESKPHESYVVILVQFTIHNPYSHDSQSAQPPWPSGVGVMNERTVGRRTLMLTVMRLEVAKDINHSIFMLHVTYYKAKGTRECDD